MNESSATVFVVDDDPAVRKSLIRLLRSAGYQAQPFASAKEFLDHLRDHSATGCLVLDLQMPGLSGLDLQRELRSNSRSLPIVFITGHGDIPTSVTAMKAGAVDFLAKPFQADDLIRAIGEAIASAAESQSEDFEREELEQRYETLTPREREVMVLVVRGLPNKRIATELGTVEKTIKVHRGRVMSKMQVRSVAELVLASLKIGITLEPATAPPRER
jgi:RNA polymerase sigma factor (sigma-70 family)